MEFKRVTTLVPGTKYKICTDFLTYRGWYMHSVGKGMHCFQNINGRRNFQDFFYNETFYEPIFQGERIQTAMEQRALNKILQKIIGDQSFTW
jgi:hypothetical protein